jgi:hypothetical protein
MSLSIVCADECGRVVGERLANLAFATEPATRVAVCENAARAEADMVLHLRRSTGATPTGLPVIAVVADGSSVGRFLAAFQSSPGCREAVVLVPDVALDDEHAAQAAAVSVLDGVCAVLSPDAAAVLP